MTTSNWREEFDLELTTFNEDGEPVMINYILPSTIKDFIESVEKEAEERVKNSIVGEIEIMEAEEPSNYPTPEDQDAVYGVLGRLKERIYQPKE